MKKLLLFTLGVGLVFAQERVSPHEKVTATIAGKKITIDYGRPSVKGRKIFGALVPFGEVWRTGADEATILTTEGDLMIGSLHVPAGSYSVFTLPTQKEWTLILNKQVKQWGAFKYDAKADFGRAPMKVTHGGNTEKFTIEIEPKGGSGAVLKMMWADTTASVDIMMH